MHRVHSTALFLVSFVLVGFSCAAALVVGCGSSSDAPAAAVADGGEDAATEAAPVEAAPVDAGPDINQDPDVYPAHHQPIPQIDFNGGAILEHIRVVTVTFTSYPADKRDAVRAFDHVITQTGWWQQTAEGYCIDGGACVGDGTSVAPDGSAWLPDGSTEDAGTGYLDVELPFDLSTTAAIDDSDIQIWLGKHIAAGDFPAPDDQTVYAIYFPLSATITSQGTTGCTAGGFEAYHQSGALLPDGGQQQVAYAVMPYCDLDGMGYGSGLNYDLLTIAASHELAEAATDPHPEADTAFYLHSNDAWLGQLSYGGGECGDMCTYLGDPIASSYYESGYKVQRIWSNSAAAASKNPCQPVDGPYFGAAVRTTRISVGGHMSDGYLVVKAGQTLDAIIDVFSEAPLTADLFLYVGNDKGRGANGPSDLAPPNPLQITLSTMQVHNGDGVIMSITAPPTTSRGNHRFVVRSLLAGTTAYNDWPVLVRVQ
jgi:hypothetical protein